MKYLPFSFQPSQRTYSATDFIHFLKHIIRLLTGLRGCKRAGEEEKKKGKQSRSNLIKAVIYQCIYAHQHIIVGTHVSAMPTDKRTLVCAQEDPAENMENLGEISSEQTRDEKCKKGEGREEAFRVSSLPVCSRTKTLPSHSILC